MTTDGFRPILSSIDLSANYVEAGDTLFVTLTWQNEGESPCGEPVRIAVDFRFDRAQRHPETLTDTYRIVWTPYPPASEWIRGRRIGTTGRWAVPEGLWGGPYRVAVSLIGEDGRTLPFLGPEGTVYSLDVGKVDVGWGWGRKKLVEQRHPVRNEILPPRPAEPEPRPDAVSIGGLSFCRSTPSSPSLPALPVAATFDRAALTVTERPAAVAPAVLSPDGTVLTYAVSGPFGEADLIFRARDGAVFLTLENVTERAGQALSSLYLPRLLAFDADGALFTFFGGGRLVPIGECLPTGAELLYDSCCAAAGADRTGGIAVDVPDMDSRLTLSVEEVNGVKHGVIGCRIMRLLPVLSDRAVPIPIPEKPVEIRRLSEPTWQAFASDRRARLPKMPLDRYRGALIYRISADKTFEIDDARPITYSPPVDFARVRSIIGRMHRISGGMRQIVYLVGWQRHGHDTEYPAPHKHGFSPRLGTEADWLETQGFAAAHNALVSFHDNFDDAYCPEAVAPSRIATDRRGDKRTGWLWAGGMSYILSPKAYFLSGDAEKRIEETLSAFGITESYHLDVLSAEIRRYDYSADFNSAAAENIGYKKKIVEAFRARGVDVTSEMLTEPFVGLLEYVLHTKYDFRDRLFPAERVIPLTTFVYHGRIRYSMGSLSRRGRAEAVAVGAVSGFDCLGAELGPEVSRSLYLHAMPMRYLAEQEVVSCEWDEKKAVVRYEDGAVTVDFETDEYRIEARGTLLTENGLSILPDPDDPGARLLYSDRDRTVTLPWDRADAPRAVILSFESVGEARAVPTADGNAILDLKADCPVRLF